MFSTDPEVARELEEKFLDALEDSAFVMLGLQGVEDSRTRPMTAHLKDGQIYFFADRGEQLVRGLAESNRAVATFAGKNHKIFAHIHGTLSEQQDRQLIDELWNPAIASWYKGGKDDPGLVLLKFATEKAEVWEAPTGAVLRAAALKLFGMEPGKKHRETHRAEVEL